MQSAGAALHHAVVLKHRGNGAEEAFHIQPKAQMLHIPAVQLGLLRDLQFIAAMDLCPAGQARAHIVCMVLVALCQQIILVPQSRPRADDRHITYKDIPQLGQLVQTGLAQEMTHAGDILVRVVQQMGGHIVGRVDAHGAEL